VSTDEAAEQDAVVVVWDGHGVADDGTAFRDSIAFDDLWSRVQP
jgi:hypothetical protein